MALSAYNRQISRAHALLGKPLAKFRSHSADNLTPWAGQILRSDGGIMLADNVLPAEDLIAVQHWALENFH
jgi:hypothetical protein